MAEYDGSIRIDTSIITKNIRPKVQEIVKSLEEIGKDAEKAREKLELLDKAGVSHASEEYKAAQAELQKYVDSYKDSMYKIAEYGSGVSDSLQFDTSKIDAAREKLQSLEDSGIDHSSKEYKEAERDLYHLIDAHERYQEVIDEFGSYTINAFEGFKKLRDETEKYINTSGIQAESTDEVSQHLNILRIDVEEYAKALKELHDQGKFFGDEDYDKIYLAWKNATDAVKTYQSELNKQTESGQAKIAEQEARAAEKREAAQRRAEEQAEKALQKENARIQKEVENQAKLEAKEAERKAREEARINAIQAKEEAKRAKEIAAIQAQEQEEQRLDQIRVNATVSNQEIVDLLERRRQLISEIKDMEAAGVGLGYQQYEDANRELEEVNGKIKEYRKNLGSVPEKFNKMRKSANKAFTAVAQGTKKSSGLLSNFTSRLKGIALSLLIFNWISKGFNAMISGMKKGFENLAGYSDSYAQSVQNMKNAMSTLGNQFAAAFAPIVQMVIPWLTSLINTLTNAISHIAQFISILSGKSTFTKAKKVQDDYNKSLGGTAKAADKARGALAKFDDLDVLEKKDNTSGGGAGAENAGADMFEEVPVDTEVLSFWQRVQEAMKPVIEYARRLKDIFSQGFFDGLGDWEYRFESIRVSILSMKDSLSNIFADPSVVSSADSWAQSVSYSIGSIVGSMASIGLTIATNLLGGISTFLEENKDRIKGYLISMFDIQAEINQKFSELFDSIAYVFEAFASEQGQHLTANIIGIFADSFMGVTELAGRLAEDILGAIIQPFVDNKEEFRTALEGFLSVLSEITGTIKEGIDETFDKLNEVYDEHIKPFFDSIATGLSDTAGKFMEFWNNDVQPILDEWAQKFDEIWKAHIQPMLDKFMDLLGDVADFLKAVWENVLKPIIDWIIENILPVLLPIFDGIIKGVMEVAGGIADVIGGIIDVISGILQFLTGVFTGDWEKAWDGVVKIFDGVWGAIKGVINGILGGVESLANGVVKAINVIIRALNGLHFDIPDWVPALGGKSFGFNINELKEVSIPRLATGSVIRGGNPFMAILGDQPRGQVNVEAPLDTIKQAVREELSGMNFGNAGVGQAKVVLNINGVDVGEAMLDDLFSVMQRRGYDVSVLGVR